MAGALWVFKAIAAAATLGIVWLVWRTAERLGRDPVLPALAVGLNPLVLVHVVGGAHNEALVVLVTMVGVALFVAGRRPAGAAVGDRRGGAEGIGRARGPVPRARHTAGTGSRRRADERRRSALAAIAAAAVAALVVALIGLAAFGSHALDALSLLSSNQERTSRWSFPYKTAELLGAVLPGDRLDYRDAVRTAYVVVFAAIFVWLLARTWRGADAIAMAGWATLAILVSSAWLVPWYVLWLLPLAVLAPAGACWSRRSRSAPGCSLSPCRSDRLGVSLEREVVDAEARRSGAVEQRAGSERSREPELHRGGCRGRLRVGDRVLATHVGGVALGAAGRNDAIDEHLHLGRVIRAGHERERASEAKPHLLPGGDRTRVVEGRAEGDDRPGNGGWEETAIALPAHGDDRSDRARPRGVERVAARAVREVCL